MIIIFWPKDRVTTLFFSCSVAKLIWQGSLATSWNFQDSWGLAARDALAAAAERENSVDSSGYSMFMSCVMSESRNFFWLKTQNSIDNIVHIIVQCV